VRQCTRTRSNGVLHLSLSLLLAGLLLNTLFELWWADPVAGLLMVPLTAKEGVGGLQGKGNEESSAGYYFLGESIMVGTSPVP
jgi:hypothetical protein